MNLGRLMHRFAWSILLASVAAGCGGDLPRVQAKGKLTANGKPLSGTEMFLTPLDPKLPGATAFTSADGSFNLEDMREPGRGVVPGEYIVGLHRMLRKDGSPFMEAPKPEDLGGALEGLPKSFAGPNSPLRLTIPPTGGEVNLDIPPALLKGK